MKNHVFIRVSCMFIMFLFSSYASAIEAQIVNTNNNTVRYTGNACVIKCPISCFPRRDWDRRLLSKNKEYIVCCIKKNDLNLYFAEENSKDSGYVLRCKGDLPFDGIKLTRIEFNRSADTVFTKPKCFLKAVVKMKLHQELSGLTDEEEHSFIDDLVNKLASYADIKPFFVLNYYTREQIKNHQYNELVDILLLLDSQTPEKNEFQLDNDKLQHASFICVDEECYFSDNNWKSVSKHMEELHPYRYPSMILSENKLNHKLKELNMLSKQGYCAPYISCQANLAHDIQKYIDLNAKHECKYNYEDIMRLYIKPTFKIKHKFDELGYGSIHRFFGRHMMTLDPII